MTTIVPYSTDDPSIPQLPPLFDLLSHRLRWAIVKQLSISDVRVNEIVNRLKQPMNVVSYHLKKLRDQQLIVARRSESDARDVYYSLNFERLRRLHIEASAEMHPLLAVEPPQLATPAARVLFVCTNNSARSQMAEAWLRHLSSDRVQVASAGIDPTTLHPEAVRAMKARGVDMGRQAAKPVEKFVRQSHDIVVTICDVAREQLPDFQYEPMRLHWGIANPEKSSESEQAEAHAQAAEALRGRVDAFMRMLPHLLSRGVLEDPTRPSYF